MNCTIHIVFGIISNNNNNDDLMYACLTYYFALPVLDHYKINIMCVFFSGLHFG